MESALESATAAFCGVHVRQRGSGSKRSRAQLRGWRRRGGVLDARPSAELGPHGGDRVRRGPGLETQERDRGAPERRSRRRDLQDFSAELRCLSDALLAQL
eukprot:scaffold2797_cov234-Pinguiococcus_pyrenoidosus.AAC.5